MELRQKEQQACEVQMEADREPKLLFPKSQQESNGVRRDSVTEYLRENFSGPLRNSTSHARD